MSGSPVVTVRWHTPSPTSIDEELIVDADGRARLAVRRPRSRRDQVGTYAGAIDPDDLAALAAAGPLVDLDLVVQDQRMARAGVVADRVASALREHPVAVAVFRVHVLKLAGGSLDLALLVSGDGDQPVEFEITVERCAIHFSDGASEVGWQQVPPQPMGFVTPDAEPLGGVRQRASVPAGVTGAIALTVGSPPTATQVWAQLQGYLYASGEVPAEFEAWTEPAPLPVV
jgi:hypothetical protein